MQQIVRCIVMYIVRVESCVHVGEWWSQQCEKLKQECDGMKNILKYGKMQRGRAFNSEINQLNRACKSATNCCKQKQKFWIGLKTFSIINLKTSLVQKLKNWNWIFDKFMAIQWIYILLYKIAVLAAGVKFQSFKILKN